MPIRVCLHLSKIVRPAVPKSKQYYTQWGDNYTTRKTRWCKTFFFGPRSCWPFLSDPLIFLSISRKKYVKHPVWTLLVVVTFLCSELSQASILKSSFPQRAMKEMRLSDVCESVVLHTSFEGKRWGREKQGPPGATCQQEVFTYNNLLNSKWRSMSCTLLYLEETLFISSTYELPGTRPGRE